MIGHPRFRGVPVMVPLVSLACIVASGWAPTRAREPSTLTRTDRHVYMMGTVVSLTTFSEHRDSGLKHLEAMVAALEDAETELSTWRHESLLSRLNRIPVNTRVAVPTSVCRLLRELHYWHRETDGAFDPALGTLIDTWDLRASGRVPSSTELGTALETAGLDHFQIEPQSCRVIRRREVTLDAGGFGKGEALDRLASVDGGAALPWLVDLGGQIMVHGHPPRATGWPIAIAHPEHRHEPLVELSLTTGSLATSGGSERDLTLDGRRLGHILNPRVGRPAGFRGAVTVWHERALVADVLSTALYVMGPERGITWPHAHGIAACFQVVRDNRGTFVVDMETTEAFQRRFPDVRHVS